MLRQHQVGYRASQFEIKMESYKKDLIKEI